MTRLQEFEAWGRNCRIAGMSRGEAVGVLHRSGFVFGATLLPEEVDRFVEGHTCSDGLGEIQRILLVPQAVREPAVLGQAA